MHASGQHTAPPDGTTTQWQAVERALQQLVDVSKPQQRDQELRASIVHRVEQAVRTSSFLEDVRIVPYGSYVSGFYNSQSDLDIAVSGYVRWSALDAQSAKDTLRLNNLKTPPDRIELYKLDRHTKQTALRKAINKLYDHRITHRDSVQYVLHARVPIIKFLDLRTNIECDLSIGGDGQDLKAFSFFLMSQVNPVFTPLYLVIKLWAKAHGINDGTVGMFNSHCLALLVVFFLQTRSPAALPPLYKLFYAQTPSPDMPRILQGEDREVLAAQAAEAGKQRVLGARQEFGSMVAPLADLLLEFVTSMRGLFERALLKPDENLRLSVWYGNATTSDTPCDFVLMVEEPMHSEDNPARTFGKKHEFPWTLHYVVDVLQRTQAALTAARAPDSSIPPLALLMFLFGPAAFLQPPTSHVLVSAAGSEWVSWVEQQLRPDRSSMGVVQRTALQHMQAPAEQWIPGWAVMGAKKFRDYMTSQGRDEARKQLRQEKAQGTQLASRVQSSASSAGSGAADSVAAVAAAMQGVSGVAGDSAAASRASSDAATDSSRAVGSEQADAQGRELEEEEEAAEGGGGGGGGGGGSQQASGSEAVLEARVTRAAAQQGLVGYPAALMVATELGRVRELREQAKRKKQDEKLARQRQEQAKAREALRAAKKEQEQSSSGGGSGGGVGGGGAGGSENTTGGVAAGLLKRALNDASGGGAASTQPAQSGPGGAAENTRQSARKQQDQAPRKLNQQHRPAPSAPVQVANDTTTTTPSTSQSTAGPHAQPGTSPQTTQTSSQAQRGGGSQPASGSTNTSNSNSRRKGDTAPPARAPRAPPASQSTQPGVSRGRAGADDDVIDPNDRWHMEGLNEALNESVRTNAVSRAGQGNNGKGGGRQRQGKPPGPRGVGGPERGSGSAVNHEHFPGVGQSASDSGGVASLQGPGQRAPLQVGHAQSGETARNKQAKAKPTSVKGDGDGAGGSRAGATAAANGAGATQADSSKVLASV